MASYTTTKSTHQTTVADTVDTVTLGGDFRQVEVVNRDGADALYFTVDELGGPSSDGVPTVAGNNTYVVPASKGAALKVTSYKRGTTVVKLISAVATAYTVQGVTA